MGDPFRELVEELRQACALDDCPLSMTVDDLASEVPAGLEWTKSVLARNALELSQRCGPAECCVRPYLEQVCALAEKRAWGNTPH